MSLYPSIDIASQYERLSSTINNYAQYYKNFKPNSFAIGLSIRFPITDFAQHAKANAAAADLLRARQEAQMASDQVAENTLQVQRSLRQLAAASDVARLEYEVAQAGIDAVRAKLASGQADARDQENARLDSSDPIFLLPGFSIAAYARNPATDAANRRSRRLGARKSREPQQ